MAKQPLALTDDQSIRDFTGIQSLDDASLLLRLDGNKHQEQVKLLIERQNEINKRNKEFPRARFFSKLPPALRAALSKPFPQEAITEISGSSGKKLSSIKSAYVIERLNTVFGLGGWDVEHDVIGIIPVEHKSRKKIWKDGKSVANPDYSPGKVDFVTNNIVAKGRIVLHEYGIATPYQYASDAYDAEGSNSLDDILKGLPTSIISKCAGNYLEVGIQVFKGNPTSQSFNVGRVERELDLNKEYADDGRKATTHDEGQTASTDQQQKQSEATPTTSTPPARGRRSQKSEGAVDSKAMYTSEDFTPEGFDKADASDHLTEWLAYAGGIDIMTVPVRSMKNGGRLDKDMLMAYLGRTHADIFGEKFGDFANEYYQALSDLKNGKDAAVPTQKQSEPKKTTHAKKDDAKAQDPKPTESTAPESANEFSLYSHPNAKLFIGSAEDNNKVNPKHLEIKPKQPITDACDLQGVSDKNKIAYTNILINQMTSKDNNDRKARLEDVKVKISSIKESNPAFYKEITNMLLWCSWAYQVKGKIEVAAPF